MPRDSRSAPAVRHATPADARAIASLVGELGYPATASEIVSRLARLDDFPDAVVFVAEIGGEIAGAVTGHVFPTIHSSPIVAWLTMLVVGTSNQRRGVGRDLTTAIETWARERGAVRLSVTSGKQRADAHAFYEGLGYERSGFRFTKYFAVTEAALRDGGLAGSSIRS
jgi:GNAT superfamily N-acetyltransferase